MLWAEARKVLGKEPNLKGFNELARDRLAWRDFSEKIIAKSWGDFSLGGLGIKNVAAYASNGVKRKWIAK